MIANLEVRKVLNQTAHSLAQREFARIRRMLEEEIATAEAAGATTQEVLKLLRARVDGVSQANATSVPLFSLTAPRKVEEDSR